MPRKKFTRNVEPIIVDIEDVHGNEFTLETKAAFTPEMSDRITELTQLKDVTAGESVVKQMEMIFGMRADNYKNFDMFTLGQVLEFVAESLNGKNAKKNDNGLTI